MTNLKSIAKQYEDGKIKEQHLEATIYAEAFKSNPDNFALACKEAANIRCATLEKTNVKLDAIKENSIDNCTLLEGNILTGIERKLGEQSFQWGLLDLLS